MAQRALDPMPPDSRPIVVATHNLMHGLRIDALVPRYLELRDREGLDLLCLQEDRYLAGDRSADGHDRPSGRIAAALGEGYQIVHDEACPGLTLVIDGRRLTCASHLPLPLPRLESLSWFERRYIVGGRTKQKRALCAELRPRDRQLPFAAVVFHLDTAGGNAHRATQVRALADAIAARDLQHRLVACGDTNAFAWRRQPEALQSLLGPLAAFGATDPETAPSHYFARQNEPRAPHRIGVLLGKLGLDLPLRYDVVCTNLQVTTRGQVSTADSDHDLVWARIAP